MAAIGTVLGGRYRLVELVSTGPHGSVFRAADSQRGREVAVKVFAAELGRDPDFLARFQSESRAAAGINHPGVTAILGFGQLDEEPFLVMELVDGESLERLLRTRGTLPPRQAARLAADVARALAAAADRGVVHHDLEPGNILVTRDGHPKVADFGIAAAIAEADVILPDGEGLPAAYWAPEQVAGGPASAAGNVFSLGVILYEALTGQRPWAGDSAAEVARAQRAGRPPAPSTLRSGISAGLDDVVARALAIEPGDRFASATALADALDAAGSGERRAAGAAMTLPLTELEPDAAPVAATTIAPEPSHPGEDAAAAESLLGDDPQAGPAESSAAAGDDLLDQAPTAAPGDATQEPGEELASAAELAAAGAAAELAAAGAVAASAAGAAPAGLVPDLSVVSAQPLEGEGEAGDDGSAADVPIPPSGPQGRRSRPARSVVVPYADDAYAGSPVSSSQPDASDAPDTVGAVGREVFDRRARFDDGSGRLDDGSGPWVWISAILGLVILLIVGFLVFRLLTASTTPASEQATVPRLVDLTYTQAEAEARKLGLVVVRFAFEPSDKPADTVLKQDPAEGSKVEKGAIVKLTLALGSQTVSVPNLVGRMESEALNQIAAFGLSIGKRSEAFDPTVPLGAVISQDPPAGNTVGKATSVNYVVSKGPAPSASPTPSPLPSPSASPSASARPSPTKAPTPTPTRAPTPTPTPDPGVTPTPTPTPDPGPSPTPTPEPSPSPSPSPSPTPTPTPTPTPVAP